MPSRPRSVPRSRLAPGTDYTSPDAGAGTTGRAEGSGYPLSLPTDKFRFALRVEYLYLPPGTRVRRGS
jgi:hypothetical protein